MKILVTGGAGFIGRYVVNALLKENKVRIYDDLSNSSEQDTALLIQKGADFVKEDILDYDKLVESCKEFDVVIHLAAKSDVADSVIHPETTMDVNVNGTINVLKACIQNKIGKIIFASSASVYGNCNELPINEETNTNPTSPYGSSKLSAENEIKKIADEFGIRYIILRMFNVYGKGQKKQYAGVISKFLKNISENKEIVIFGDGKQTRDFISINDVVESFDCAIKSKTNGTYNIASGISVSINELAQIMFDIFRKKPRIKFQEEHKGDIKNSVTDILLAKNELNFSAKKILKKELTKI